MAAESLGKELLQGGFRPGRTTAAAIRLLSQRPAANAGASGFPNNGDWNGVECGGESTDLEDKNLTSISARIERAFE